VRDEQARHGEADDAPGDEQREEQVRDGRLVGGPELRDAPRIT
jgi:hypothetical protein